MAEKKERDATEAEMENAAAFMIAMMKKNGVAISSVKNGYLLMFTREKLESILKENPKAPAITIMVQTPDAARETN